jgi:broad-specificity NMP kinase/uncharacterized protein (UPF0218 family)
MIIAITGTPGTGKTEVAKALAKRMKWPFFSLNEIAEKNDFYQGYDKERMAKIVDMDKLREEVNVLASENRNIIIESHYAHGMPCDLVIVLRTEPSVLRKRMTAKGFHSEKIAENLEAEMMEVISDEAKEANANVREIDTTRKTAAAAAKEIEKIAKDLGSRPFLSRDLIVPEDLLMDFRRPFGKVFAGPEDEAAGKAAKGMKGSGLVVTVGDQAAYSLIRQGLKPDMIIVDGREKRKRFTRKIPFRGTDIKVRNPPRHITVELWKAIEKSIPDLKRRKVRILVKGEEDLAVLPCAIHLPVGSRIAYGQPGEGLIVVNVDAAKKERAKAILENIMYSQ